MAGAHEVHLEAPTGGPIQRRALNAAWADTIGGGVDEWPYMAEVETSGGQGGCGIELVEIAAGEVQRGAVEQLQVHSSDLVGCEIHDPGGVGDGRIRHDDSGPAEVATLWTIDAVDPL